MIEFDLEGNILEANDLFLRTVGYDRSEVIGKHHSIFLSHDERNGIAYQSFWRDLKSGKASQAEFARVGKGGRRVWLQATYTPICGTDGSKPFKIIKYATDIAGIKAAVSNAEGQLAAMGKAQAVIEFDQNGKILDANDNFLNALGYTLGEICGQHHSMFVPAPSEPARLTRNSDRNSPAASMMRTSISGLERVGGKSGSRPATTRSTTHSARHARS